MADDFRSRALNSALAEKAYGSVFSSQYAEAQKSAQANEAARRLGIAPDLVESDMPNMLAEDRLRKRVAETQRNTAYARIMSNRRLAAAAIDDDELPKVAERAQEHAGSGTRRFGDLVNKHGYLGAATRTLGSVGTKFYYGLGQAGGAAIEAAGDFVAENTKFNNPFDGGKSYLAGIGKVQDNFINRTGREAGAYFKTKSEGDTVTFENYYGNEAMRGIESVPMSAMALVMAARGKPKQALAMMGGFTGALEYGEARREGLSPIKSTLFAGVQGGLEAAGEALPILRYVDDIGKGIGKRIFGQLVTENIGEQFTGQLQDLNRWAMIEANQGKTFVEFAKERPEAALSIAIATTTATGVQTGAAYGVERALDKYDQRVTSVDRVLKIDRVMQAAAASPTRTSNPSDFREALNQIVGNGQVYVPVDKIIEDIGDSDAPISEHPVWGAYADQIDAAVALGGRGGDVVIGLADAVTDMAGTTSWDAIRDHVRDRPGGSSISEAQQKRSPEALAGIAAQMDAVVKQAVPAMQNRRALTIVKDFGQTLLPGNVSETGANQINRLAASFLVAQFNRLSEKRAKQGLPAVTLEQFAQDNLPSVQRMLQDQYESGEAGVTTLSATGESDGSQAGDGNQADAGTVRDGGRVRRGFELLDAAAGAEPGLDLDRPLEGAPTELTVPGRGKVAIRPFAAARSAARAVAQSLGLTYSPATTYAKVDPARAARIADAFEAMEHNPNDPTVAASYQAMIAETLAQYQAIKATGLEIEFIEGEDPYAASPRLAILDATENNHLWVFPTDFGFGSPQRERIVLGEKLAKEDAQALVDYWNGVDPNSTSMDVTRRPSQKRFGPRYDVVRVKEAPQIEAIDSPMLQPTDEFIGSRRLLVNDVFRIVHDYFGHIKEGHGFRAEGEENAWQSHAAMYSPLARRAMTTETRGQNSWVNFGPFTEHNKTASGADTVYAPQKVGLLPEWVSEEGFEGGDARQIGYHGTPFDFDEFRTAGGAVWFSATPQLAGAYADPRRIRRWSGARIIPAALSFKNPLVITNPADGMVDDPQAWAADNFGFNLAAHGWQREGPLSIHAVTRSAAFADAARGAGFDALSMIEGITQTWGMLNRNTVTSTIGGQTLFQSAAPLQANAMPITGTGPGGRILNRDLGVAFTMRQRAKYGRPLDPDSEEDYAVILSALNEDYAEQQDQADNGEAWYSEDIAEAVRITTAIMPELAVPANRDLFLTIAALLSPQQKPAMNWDNAIVAMQGYLKDGKIALRKPTGKQFGVGSHTTGLQLMQHLIDQYGIEGANLWVRTPQTGRAMAEVRQASGLFAVKDKIGGYLPSETNLNETKLGIYMMGPKVGDFMQNSVGIDQSVVTVDLWLARTYNRVIGRLVDTPDGDLAEQVRGREERENIKRLVRDAATAAGIDPSAMQAALWYFEQRLYRNHGIQAKSENFSGAALQAATKRGVDTQRRAVEQGAVGSEQDAGLDAVEGILADPVERAAFLAAARAPAEVATFNQEVTAPEEVFYSAAQRVVAEAKQEKASAQQWKALLTPGKTPGIKSEEIEWTAIHDWLDMQQGQIEKGALLQVLRDRGIRVEEVVLSPYEWNWEEVGYSVEQTEDADGDEAWTLLLDGEVVGEEGDYRYRDDAIQVAREGAAESGGDSTQFKSWSSDPSNDTYRELLITIPLGQGGNPSRAPSTHWDTEAVVAHVRFMEKTDADGKRVLFIEEVQSDWHQKGRDQGYSDAGVDPEAAQQEYGAARDALYDAKQALIAHAEQNEMLDRFKFNQTIRTLGFDTQAEALAEMADAPLELVADYRAADLRFNEARQASYAASKGIPEAPFKSSWPALVMKRMIAHAAREGYDRIAWTTGKEQSERYNLGSAVGEIVASSNGDGEYRVRFNDRAEDTIVENGLAQRAWDGPLLMTADKMKEAFGADVANKIVERVAEAEAKPELIAAKKELADAKRAHDDALADDLAGEGDGDSTYRAVQDTERAMMQAERKVAEMGRFVKLDGSDLNVGGEGMRAFYDRNLVNITNDIVKKYGAKVGPVNINANKAANDFDKEIKLKLGSLAMGIETAQQAEERAAEYEAMADRGEGDTQVARMWARRLRDGRGLFEQRDMAAAGTPHPGFDITPKLRDAAAGGFTLFQKKRGNISLPRDGEPMSMALIRAFESANFSTAVHELGHFFLEDLRRRALASDASDQEIADWQAFKTWGASLGQDIKDDSPIPVDAHEYFARGFERYTWEGKAPTAALRGLFLQLREFMKKLYTKASQFDAPITPEIREVMGRMIASDAEVAEQTREMNLAAGKIDELMTPEERRIFADLTDEAREDARDKAMERALSALRQEKTAEVRERKEQIRQEVSAEVDEMPLMRALKLLKVGIPQTDGTFIKVRLGREQLKDAYGDDVLDTLPKLVPEIHSDKDAQDLDTIAGLTGFASGDAMVRALQAHASAQAEMKEGGDRRSPRARMIDEQVEDRVREEIGDPFENLEEEAQSALANERQADADSLVLRALGRKVGKKPTAWKAAKEFAAKYVMKATSAEAISGRAIQMYTRNATKAGQEVTEAIIKGDMEEAFAAKQRQLLNLALLSEAKIAKDKVDAAQRRLSKIAKRKTIPSVDQDYLEQAQALLEDVSMGDESRPAIERRKSFEDWYLQQVAEGKDPVVPKEYAALLGKGNWKDLSIEDFLELDAAVAQIIALGRFKQTLRDGQEIREFQEVKAELVGTAELQAARKLSTTTDETRNLKGRIKSRLRGIDAAMLKVQTLAGFLDGGNPNGPWTRIIYNVMSAAGAREALLRRQYIDEINTLIKGLGRKTVRSWDRVVDTPELVIRNRNHTNYGEAWSGTKDQVVMMAMNWGNEGNRQRLLDGFGWDENAMLAVFDRHMDKVDWDFVQGVWDTVNKLWPEIEAMERRVNGVAPAKIEAVEVETKYGTYTGGYFPASYDVTQSVRAEMDDASRSAPMGAWHDATTRSSATRARVEAVKGRPLLLSMSVITRHMGEVIHDVTHREAVAQVQKVLSDKDINTVINTRFGPEYSKMMKGWLDSIAVPNVAFSKSNGTIVALGRFLNKGISSVGLGLRLTTVLQQYLGISNIISEIGIKRMSEGFAMMHAHPKRTYQEIVALSPKMATRWDTLDASIDDMVANVSGGGLQVIGPRGIQKWAFDGIRYADVMVAGSAWIGAYNQALAGEVGGEVMSEEEAVIYADRVVQTTQGGGGAEDRAAILSEHPFLRSFYPFFSYLSSLYNQQRIIGRALKQGEYAEAARRTWWVAIVPMLVQALIFGEGPEDEDEDGVTFGDWADYLGANIVLGNLGSIPGIGAFASALGHGYGYRASSVQQVGEAIVDTTKLGYDLATDYDETEITGRDVKGVMNTVGFVTGRVPGQIGSTAQGAYDYATGEAQPEDAGDWYELLAKGRTSKGPTSMEQLMGEEVE